MHAVDPVAIANNPQPTNVPYSMHEEYEMHAEVWVYCLGCVSDPRTVAVGQLLHCFEAKDLAYV